MLTYVHCGWLVIALFWATCWFLTARSAWREPNRRRSLHIAGTAVGFGLLFDPQLFWPFKSQAVFVSAVGTARTGVLLCSVGWVVAVWARIVLGRYWSASVSLKENHCLMQAGPYSVVRHPIYSGLLLALLGTAFANNQLQGFLGFAILLLFWGGKALTEEKLLAGLFGHAYREYRNRTGMLFPRIS